MIFAKSFFILKLLLIIPSKIKYFSAYTLENPLLSYSTTPTTQSIPLTTLRS
jgi:hypothetical protein